MTALACHGPDSLRKPMTRSTFEVCPMFPLLTGLQSSHPKRVLWVSLKVEVRSGELMGVTERKGQEHPWSSLLVKWYKSADDSNSYWIVQSKTTIYFVKYSHNPAAFKSIQFNYISSTHTQNKLNKCDKHNLEMTMKTIIGEDKLI